MKDIDKSAVAPDRCLCCVITVSSDPPLFIVLKQSAGGQTAPAPAGAYSAQNRQYVMPQQASATPAQLGLAASMAAAPALQQWLAAHSAPPAAPRDPARADGVNAQISALREQITQSENNLNAQHSVRLHLYCTTNNVDLFTRLTPLFIIAFSVQ